MVIYSLSNHFDSFNVEVVFLLKLRFCKRHHHIKGHETCVGRSRRRHLTDKFDDRVGNLNDPIFKSLNAWALPGGGGVS